MDQHRVGELRSIRYHAAIAARLDASTVSRALARLDDWERRHVIHPQLARAWRVELAAPVELLAARLVEDNEHMARMRSSSPFAGELQPRERWQLWREVKAEADRT